MSFPSLFPFFLPTLKYKQVTSNTQKNEKMKSDWVWTTSAQRRENSLDRVDGGKVNRTIPRSFRSWFQIMNVSWPILFTMDRFREFFVGHIPKALVAIQTLFLNDVGNKKIRFVIVKGHGAWEVLNVPPFELDEWRGERRTNWSCGSFVVVMLCERRRHKAQCNVNIIYIEKGGTGNAKRATRSYTWLTDSNEGTKVRRPSHPHREIQREQWRTLRSLSRKCSLLPR